MDARVVINNEIVGEGKAMAVLGNPFNSLAWLANKLAEVDMCLRAGEYVMTGSLTRQFALQAGDRVVTQFNELGKVEFRLS
jgi:2-keto-4-pentenoate hydratase